MAKTDESPELYKKIKVEKCSYIIKQRKLSWVGHLLRLDKETPAERALTERLRGVPRKNGKGKNTWIGVIGKDFKELIYINNCNMIENLIIKSRKQWKKLIQYMMLNKTAM